MATLLIAEKADVNCQDRWGGRPLDDALRRGHQQCVALLQAHGGVVSEEALSSHRSDAPGAEGSGSARGETTSLLVDWADLQVLEKLGSGAFGDIVKCRWRGTLVAAKMIKSGESLRGGALFTDGSPSPTELRQEAVADFRQEIAFLGSLRHPNICLLLGYSLT